MPERLPDFGHFEEEPVHQKNAAPGLYDLSATYSGSTVLNNMATLQIYDRPLTGNTRPVLYAADQQ